MWGWLRSIPVTVVIAITSVVLFLCPSLGNGLEFQFDLAESLTIVQVLGCHLLHFGTEHLAWDLLVFVCLGALCERRHRFRYILTLLVSALTIPVVAALSSLQVADYRGLSGIDTALFSLLIVELAAEAWRSREHGQLAMYAALWVAMLGKIGFEIVTGGTLFVQEAGFVPLPIAHFMGALIGAGVAWLSNPKPTPSASGIFAAPMNSVA